MVALLAESDVLRLTREELLKMFNAVTYRGFDGLLLELAGELEDLSVVVFGGNLVLTCRDGDRINLDHMV